MPERISFLSNFNAQELFASAQTETVFGPVDGEDSIQVVHFVLDQFGEGIAGVQFSPGAGPILVFQPDCRVAPQTDHEVGKGEAIVPELKRLRAALQVLRVDQLVRAAIDMEKDDAAGVADLNGGDAASKTMGTAERGEGIAEVGQERGDGGGLVHRSGDLPQDGIAELKDALYGHPPILRAGQLRNASLIR